MTRTILRSVTVALIVLAVQQGAAFGGFLAFCAHHRAWRRVVDRQSSVIPVTGFGVARPGDAVYVCATSHCFGPLGCHDDLACVCAPATHDASLMESQLGGSCVIDQPYPLRADRAGSCPPGRCDDHFGR